MISRDDYDDNGLRCARCGECGMVWIENRESTELFPGEWTTAGERPHECPEPYPYETAKYMVEAARSMGGIVVSPTQKARIRLGLAQGHVHSPITTSPAIDGPEPFGGE